VLNLDRRGSGPLCHGERALPTSVHHQPHLLMCYLALDHDQARSWAHLPGHVTAWHGSIEHIGERERRYLYLCELGRCVSEHVAWAREGGSLSEDVTPENLPPSSEG
jgi:hypothetical protein